MWYYRAFPSLPRRMSNQKSRRSKSSSWADTAYVPICEPQLGKMTPNRDSPSRTRYCPVALSRLLRLPRRCAPSSTCQDRHCVMRCVVSRSGDPGTDDTLTSALQNATHASNPGNPLLQASSKATEKALGTQNSSVPPVAWPCAFPPPALCDRVSSVLLNRLLAIATNPFLTTQHIHDRVDAANAMREAFC